MKRNLLRKIQQDYTVVLAIDDNPAVIALWKANDIPVIVVPGWGAELAPRGSQRIEPLSGQDG